MEETLRDWDALFAELREEAAGQTTRVRSRYKRCAETFQPRHDEARRQLDSVVKAPAAAWRQLKPNLDASVEELREIVDRAKIA